MQIYLSASPGEEQNAARRGLSIAHVAYRIGSGCRLLRKELLLQTRGGLLSLSDREAPALTAPAQLSSELLRECGRRNYSGIVLDFEEAPTADRRIFVEILAYQLQRSHKTLFVPESYAAAPGAMVLVCSAISGGSYPDYLREVIGKYDGHLALDFARLAMDFSLPQPSGEGVPLSPEQLRQRRQDFAPSIFFSQELCARYFTYTRNGQTHFVLFDDGDTLLRKIRIADSLGISSGFLMYPEVSDLLNGMFPQR